MAADLEVDQSVIPLNVETCVGKYSEGPNRDVRGQIHGLRARVAEVDTGVQESVDNRVTKLRWTISKWLAIRCC